MRREGRADRRGRAGGAGLRLAWREVALLVLVNLLLSKERQRVMSCQFERRREEGHITDRAIVASLLPTSFEDESDLLCLLHISLPGVEQFEDLRDKGEGQQSERAASKR